jgi:O-antigen/teichoic acid export membrane protein
MRLFANNKVFRNASWLFAGGMLTTALIVIQQSIVARYLGPTIYGVLALVITAGEILVQLIDFRSWETATTFTPRLLKGDLPGQALDLIKWLVLLEVGSGAIATILLIGFSLVASDMLNAFGRFGLYAAILPFIFINNGVSGAIMRLFDRFSWLVGRSVAAAALRLTIVALVVWYGGTVETVIAAYVLAEALTALISLTLVIVVLRRVPDFEHNLSLLRWPKKLDAARDVMRFSWQAWLSGTVKGIQTRFDLAALGFLAPTSQVGLYRSSLDLTSTISKLSNPFQAAIFPELSHLSSSGNKKRFIKVCWQTFLIMALMILPALLILTFAKAQIITLLLGEAYLPAGSIMVALAWGLGINAMFGWLRPALLSIGKIRVVNRVAFITAAIDMALILVLVPRWGAFGAAVATMTMYVLTDLLLLFALVRSLGQDQPMIEGLPYVIES